MTSKVELHKVHFEGHTIHEFHHVESGYRCWAAPDLYEIEGGAWMFNGNVRLRSHVFWDTWRPMAMSEAMLCPYRPMVDLVISIEGIRQLAEAGVGRISAAANAILQIHSTPETYPRITAQDGRVCMTAG